MPLEIGRTSIPTDSILPPPGTRSKPDPRTTTITVLAEPGAGKTTMFQMIEDALVFNLDGSSTPGPITPKAYVWPAVNSKSQFVHVGPDGDPERGTPFTLTWSSVLAAIDKFVIQPNRKAMASGGNPVVRTVIFDTADAMLDLLSQYLVENAMTLGLAKDKPATFEQIGLGVWKQLRAEILSLRHMLVSNGVGVIFLCQLRRRYERLGSAPNDPVVIEERPELPPSIFALLTQKSEVVLTIVTAEAMVKGQVVTKRSVRTTISYKTKGAKEDFVSKTRRTMPHEIHFEDFGAWEAFATAYQNSDTTL